MKVDERERLRFPCQSTTQYVVFAGVISGISSGNGLRARIYFQGPHGVLLPIGQHDVFVRQLQKSGISNPKHRADERSPFVASAIKWNAVQTSGCVIRQHHKAGQWHQHQQRQCIALARFFFCWANFSQIRSPRIGVGARQRGHYSARNFSGIDLTHEGRPVFPSAAAKNDILGPNGGP